MSNALTEGGICGRCREHTGFELVEGEVVSECCGWAEWDPSNYEPHEPEDPWSGGFARNH